MISSLWETALNFGWSAVPFSLGSQLENFYQRPLSRSHKRKVASSYGTSHKLWHHLLVPSSMTLELGKILKCSLTFGTWRIQEEKKDRGKKKITVRERFVGSCYRVNALHNATSFTHVVIRTVHIAEGVSVDSKLLIRKGWCNTNLMGKTNSLGFL